MAEQTTQPGKEVHGTGTNTMETTGNAKLDARKLIMARAESGRQAEVDIDENEHPSAAAIAQAIAEAAGGDLSEEEALAVTEESLLAHQNNVEASQSTGTPELDAAGEVVPEPIVDDVPAPAATATVTPPGEEDVALQVFGQTVYLPKSEVEARGGVAATQMLLAADHRFRQATQLADDAKRLHTAAASKLDEATRLERDLLARSSASGGTPAAQQPGQTTNQPLSDDSLRAAAKKLTGEMWKGDPEATERALTEVFAMIATRGTNAKVPTAEEIARLVQTKVEAGLLQARANDTTARVKAEHQREAGEVNHLMATKYKAIDTNPELRAMAQGLFRAARADARNKGRSLVSIADDVGARVLETIGQSGAVVPQPDTPAAVRQELRTRTTLKRRLPQPSSASERAAPQQQEQFPTKGSEIVAMMRAARNQPVN